MSRREFLTSLEELTCPICQESFEGKDKGRHYPVEISGCRHVYGAECLETWVMTTSCSSHNTCPTCRAVLFSKSRRRRANWANRANQTSQSNQASQFNQANRQYHYPDEVPRRQMITVEEATRADEEYDGQEQAVLAWHIVENEEATQSAVNEEWERARVHQQRETAYNELSRDVLLFGAEGGLMAQFLSYAVREIANDCYNDRCRIFQLFGYRLAARLCG
jgi:hypothetical protein